MKIKKTLVALTAFGMGALITAVYPAIAENPDSGGNWKITISRPGNAGTVHFVRHNRVTGQTYVLSCVSACGKKLSWLELPVEVAQ